MTDPGPNDTTEHQEEAAVAALLALPPESTSAVVAKVVGQLDADQQRKAAGAALSALPRAGQEDVFGSVLGTSDPKTQRVLWYIVVLTIAAAIFVFGALTFVLILLGKSGEAPLALAATALGGIVGLTATSLVDGRRH